MELTARSELIRVMGVKVIPTPLPDFVETSKEEKILSISLATSVTSAFRTG
jgi:hypothetical protein